LRDESGTHVLLFLVIFISLIFTLTFFNALIQTVDAQPSVIDDDLNVEAAVEGLSSPTGMAFLDDNNILVLEKRGNIRLVSNGVLQEQLILQVSVNAEGERGLLGVAISKDSSSSDGDDDNGSSQTATNVFLYYTQGNPLRNRVYKYQWNGETLINPQLILDLPAGPRPNHNGGKISIGPDGYLYTVIGDKDHDGQLQNYPDGPPPDNTGSIFRINPEDGSAAPDNPFVNSNDNALSKYYAYGIRNSFGIDFDPVTGNLWDTENGPDFGDEINLVEPGFNSGWEKTQGIWDRQKYLEGSIAPEEPSNFVNFGGKGKYSTPEFTWKVPVGVTSIKFLDSDKLGEEYENDMFVADIHHGNIYHFEVNENRDGISIDTNQQQQQSGLSDLVVDNEHELSAITFGNGFGGITDIETGPDGPLYVLADRDLITDTDDDGIIYKISSNDNTQ
jgi:glucose/arabinose dehydrogenase